MKQSMLAAVVAATLLAPVSLLAMDVQQFARMAPDDQKHYLSFLVGEAQQLLRQEGKQAEAQKVRTLFHDVPHGSEKSVGESQFESSFASILDAAREGQALGGRFITSVSAVLTGVLINNHIALPSNFDRTLDKTTDNRAFYQKPH